MEEIEIEGLDDGDKSSGDFLEESVYDSKSEFKKPILAMEAVRACREARAKEMTKGFWNTKLDRLGNAVKFWVNDERKIYINSVIALQKFLSAECETDEKYKEAIEELQPKIKEVFEKYAYVDYDYDSKTGGWKKSQRRFIPQVDEELLVSSVQNPSLIVNVGGGWNSKINAYYDELVPIYDQIFEELNKLIYRLNDFGQKFSN